VEVHTQKVVSVEMKPHQKFLSLLELKSIFHIHEICRVKKGRERETENQLKILFASAKNAITARKTFHSQIKQPTKKSAGEEIEFSYNRASHYQLITSQKISSLTLIPL
jgi:hypothetical protein